MPKYYTDEKNTIVLIALLRAHGIRKVVASPGTTNIAFVGSLQNDPYFEMYSCVDERSAAYMACGLAAESGEPVVITCTGATASRNYLSGLTEAFHRKLPVLAVTATQAVSKVGHHVAQVIDRTVMPKDVVRFSVTLPIVKDDDDLWDCEVKANRAILELSRHGGGPVHINNPTTYSRLFHTRVLPDVRIINRITLRSEFPDIPCGKIAVFIGAHKAMSEEQTEILDRFCASTDAVVFCDHTSSYKGKYRVLYSLAACQRMFDSAVVPDVLVHIGEVTGDYSTIRVADKQVWRVSEDGEIRDTFQKLRYIFEMPEQDFFEHYTKNNDTIASGYLETCKSKIEKLYSKIPDLPFSNVWVASRMAHLIPEDSTIHFGILNSLRSWNFFELPKSVTSASNVGGFGIDGDVSSLFGASLVNKNNLYFGVVGDLAFFYDLNVIGNRHIGNNLRILLINNGKGSEFKLSGNPGFLFGEEADKYI
ncbi:MAG: 2-succinyl-5-enolpyruvyl-6-hydroxy-3-cyclohexene-1-carboxylate synthase, partial [Deltaproteobacteria bacterium]|nr:2-succinyl-5-enolpyruvyl-6-hydroxy-3-cyclohexene-1-carboxylate synthase [Deltaproteobacteria bacterium]